MSRPSQTEVVYFLTLQEGKKLCPDFPEFKIFRAIIVRSKVPITFVRSKEKFVRSKIDNLCLHVQTIVRSNLAMSMFSCVPKENFCAPKLKICAFMSRLSCVQNRLCPDFCVFQTKNSRAPKRS